MVHRAHCTGCQRLAALLLTLAGLLSCPVAGLAESDIDTSLFVAAGTDLPALAVQTVVTAPPPEVFAAWTTPEGLQGFLGVEAQVELRIGGEMELFFGPDLPEGQRGSEGCQILTYIPDRLLCFTWNAPPHLAAERTKRTWVTVEFLPLDLGCTELRLTHLGFGPGGRWDEVRAYFSRAWPNVLKALAAHFPDRDLQDLASWMTGSFSSAAQAAVDPDFYDIRLEMVPIWPDRPGGVWIYVEQATASKLDQPYRQRIYHLHPFDERTLESMVFALPDPGRFVGAWRAPARFADLAPDSLVLREGCAIQLERRADGAFSGSTQDQDCRSSLSGAAFATSSVTITPHAVVSWDRGYDAARQQVWGAEEGGYVFDKIGSADPER